MTDAEILDSIAALAREHLNFAGTLRPEARLVEDLDLDSLKTLTLAIEVENRFRIRLDDGGDEAGIATVADLVAAVRRRLDG